MIEHMEQCGKSFRRSSPVRRGPLLRAICALGLAAAMTVVPAVGASADSEGGQLARTGRSDVPAANEMGFVGCSMAENVVQGYVAVGGTRLWGPYGTGGLVVQAWTDPNSNAWQKFDQQANRFGKPTAVWVQICVFAQAGATYDEVKRIIANARRHAAPGAAIHITGQPLYDAGQTCFLAGANGPQLTDNLARQAAADSAQNVTYAGAFRLKSNEVADGCHANTAGQQSLGRQAVAFWG